MIVKHAKEVARQWVMEEGSKVPGFFGAFYHGSVNWLPEDAALRATSDIDLMVVLSGPDPPRQPGKLFYREVLIEVSYLPREQIVSAGQILGHYQMAGNFMVPSIILDPSGELTRLQTVVSRDFAKRWWVRKRCEQARNNVLKFLDSLNNPAPLHGQVTAWLFATGVTTHVLLVAGLKNPTVRRRYLATRELLVDYSRLDFYEALLELLGCAKMSQGRVEVHLAELAQVFDVAKSLVKPSYRFAADLSDRARPIAIEGSRELIESGYHREAIFWMLATYSRCQHVLSQDAPVEVQEKASRGYRGLLGDLGITSFADLEERSKEVKAFLPRVWEVAEAIMAANPGITN